MANPDGKKRFVVTDRYGFPAWRGKSHGFNIPEELFPKLGDEWIGRINGVLATLPEFVHPSGRKERFRLYRQRYETGRSEVILNIPQQFLETMGQAFSVHAEFVR